MRAPWVRVGLALVATLVLHLTLLGRVSVGGCRPDAVLLLAVTAGLVAGPERGAVAGFSAGVLADLFLPSPFGLSALAYSLVGFGVGSIQAGVLRATWWIAPLTALAASAGGIVLYAVLAAMVGQPDFVTSRLPLVAALVGLMNAVLSPAAVRLASWSFVPAPAGRPYAR